MGEKILVLGSSNMDLILRIPRFPKPGETLIGEDLVTAYGGKGANQAIAAKRMGGKVSLITKLGNDAYGHSYREYFIQNGFDPKYILKDPKLPTGVAFIQLSPRGENSIIVSPGANGSLSLRDLKTHPGAWQGVGVFVTQLETPLPTIISGLKTATRLGALTLLNPSPVAPLPPDILPLVDFLVLNEGEAATLAGMKMRKRSDLSEMAERLMQQKVKNVVITLGGKGLFFKSRSEEFWMEAFPVKPVDTTAAGDAFMGAFACGLAEEKPIREGLSFANGAGALATTKLGAQPSLPRRKDLERFLAGAEQVRKVRE